MDLGRRLEETKQFLADAVRPEAVTAGDGSFYLPKRLSGNTNPKEFPRPRLKRRGMGKSHFSTLSFRKCLETSTRRVYSYPPSIYRIEKPPKPPHAVKQRVFPSSAPGKLATSLVSPNLVAPEKKLAHHLVLVANHLLLECGVLITDSPALCLRWQPEGRPEPRAGSTAPS